MSGLPIIEFDPDTLPKPDWYRTWAWAYDDGHLTDMPRHGHRIETASTYGTIKVTRWFRETFPNRLIFLESRKDRWKAEVTGSREPVGWLIPDEEAAVLTALQFSA